MALREVPEADGVGRIVDAVKEWWSSEGATGCEDQMARLGWTLRENRLGAAAGGLQALLLPRLYGGFAVVVDPDLTPEQVAAQLDPILVRRWRVAHEYAHTFFYGHGSVPRRGSRPGPAEEVFCDQFANHITSLNLASCSGGHRS